ncbi:hypothetical protein RDWZM_008981 [Blomia tropicalis]|uniref:IkappaB kinase n=1 Tax=Blomia tropicalis TaxID=40697 RepID=A0A9Q0RKK0_BLOTA|nr:hypothetical protein BLOT_004829 [Blomia tropicalis]KAJ6217824.1 hypothetical protein RDWZM_008981 [Blomia tropicalis]
MEINLNQTGNNNNIGQSNGTSIDYLNELVSIQNWKREQTLGSGSFAIITLWINTENGERIALKQFRNQHTGAYYNVQWKQEIEMMKRLDCENVVKALDLPKAFQSLRVDSPILAMEFCNGGDLRKVLNKPYNCCGLEEREVRQILSQISCAIEYLHERKIIHRDLKPENIVLQPLSRGKILYKLTDLGYAKQLSDSTLASSFVGTLEYLAPELFLRGKHSAAVDNWSFGLLAYEVITGRRPFLPNHIIGEILDVLKKNKKSEHICTEVNEEGNFYFSSEISQFSHICSALKADLESWLRVVLEYDPDKRGGQKAFKMINELMRKCIVQVFAIHTYETFSYEITEKTTLTELKEKLFSNTNISIKHQYLILPNGEKPMEQIGSQIIDTWYKPESWFEHYNPIIMYVLDYSQNFDKCLEFYKSLTLPSMVEKMLLNPNRSMDYDEVKLTWKNSVWVARQSVKKYRLYHSQLKSCLLHCINVYNQLQSKHYELDRSLTTLFASADVLKNFIRFSVQQSRLRSEQCNMKPNVDLCLKVATILKSIYKFRNEKVKPLFEKTRTIVPQFNKNNFMFETHLKSSDIDPSLSRKYNDILTAYDSLRKRKKEERNKQIPVTHMVNLLCGCLQVVERLMMEMFSILRTFVQFIKNVDQLKEENKEFQNLVKQWQTNTAGLNAQSWTQLTDCLVPKQDVKALSTTNHSKFHITTKDQNNDLEKQCEQIELTLSALDDAQSRWSAEKIDFTHLEFYNLLF